MRRMLAALLFTAAPVLNIFAQAPDRSLEDLVHQAEQGGRDAARVNAQREQTFLRARQDQAALLATAEAELAQARARAASARSRFEAGQKTNLALRTQLQERSADYAQVYAATKDVSGALLGQLGESTVGAQFPKRIELLRVLAQQAEVPRAEQLDALWLELLRDMSDNGSVGRFTAPVRFRDGSIRDAQVLRVGVFSALTDGRYLSVENGHLTEPQSQPSLRYRRAASAYADSHEATAAVMIDPSKGKLLLLDAARPSVSQRIEQGGAVGYLIIAIGVIGFMLAMFQALFLQRTRAAVRRQMRSVAQPRSDNPLGRVLLAFAAAKAPQLEEETADAAILELRLFEAVSREKPRLIRFQSFIRLVVAAGPLLGLVGTVAGMIVTFQVITELGAGDPKAMAQGISQAMIATLLGLGIAIPLLFVNAWLGTRSRELLQVLDEQATGLLARTLEARNDNTGRTAHVG